MTSRLVLLIGLALILQRETQAATVGEGCEVGGQTYKVGEKFAGPVGECSWNTCDGDGQYSGVSCGTFQVLPESGCHITETDLTKRYPDCCPRAVCPDTPPTHATLTVEE